LRPLPVGECRAELCSDLVLGIRKCFGAWEQGKMDRWEGSRVVRRVRENTWGAAFL
jgi:hypothetical protein